MRAAVAVAMAIMLSGCAAGPALFGPQTGTVTGHVTVRACGGAYRPDQNACQPRPRPSVQLTFSKSGSPPQSVDVDNNGAYTIELSPGTYTVKLAAFGSSLSPDSGPVPHFVGPSHVTVSAGKTVRADFTQIVELL